MVDSVHAITGYSGKPMELCVFGYGSGSSVYGLDSEYESIGVDVLMANKVP